MRRLRSLFIVSLLLVGSLPVLGQRGPVSALKIGIGIADPGFVVNGGADIGYMFTPYLGMGVQFNAGANSTGDLFVGTPDHYSKEWVLEGRMEYFSELKEHESHITHNSLSYRTYTVGLYFHPIAIALPNTRHLLALKLSVGAGVENYTVFGLYKLPDKLPVTSLQSPYLSHKKQVSMAYGAELSYAYRVVGPMTLGLYVNALGVGIEDSFLSMNFGLTLGLAFPH